MSISKHSIVAVLIVFCNCRQSAPSHPLHKIVLGMEYAKAKSILVRAGFPEWESPARDMEYPDHVLLCEYGIDPHTSLFVFTEKSTGKIIQLARVTNTDKPKGERRWTELSEITVTRGQIQTTATQPTSIRPTIHN
jgi:hypothetical protein